MNVYEVVTIGLKKITAEQKAQLAQGNDCLVFTDETNMQKAAEGVKEAIAPDSDASSSEVKIKQGSGPLVFLRSVGLDTVASNLMINFECYKTMLLQDQRGIYKEYPLSAATRESLKAQSIQSLSDFKPG